MPIPHATVRRLWHLFEPVHALVYFAPEKKSRYEGAGLKGGWMGYFASRSAALGAVSAETVIATFYNFAPRMVRRAIPDAWTYSTPGAVLEARLDVVDAALTRILGDYVTSEDVMRCGELLRKATGGCRPEGRPLFAAHTGLDWPKPPHLMLWHAATLLREFRGDGHVAALMTHALDGCEANVMITASGLTDRDTQPSYRGWTVEEWSDAEDRLRRRGLLDDAGAPTPAGGRFRAQLEDVTDALAAPPFEELSDGERHELGTGLERICRKLSRAGAVEYPNPMGLPRILND